MKTKLSLIFSAVLTIGSFVIISCEGPEGLAGPQDSWGVQRLSEPVGPAGEGTTMHAGEGEPANSTGEVGDYYLDLISGNLFGPKPAEGWGEPIHLHGPQGPSGEDDGARRLFTGDGEPDGGLGSEGDYYLDRNNYDLYGPKIGNGWEPPIHLQGPQ